MASGLCLFRCATTRLRAVFARRGRGKTSRRRWANRAWVVPADPEHAISAARPSGYQPTAEGEPEWLGFTFTLELPDGTSANLPSFHTVVPTWRPGDTIPLGAGRTLRVVAIRDNDADPPPALVVQ